ncbi:MAG: hypothetical protein JXR65_04730 [Bacteroidales bacterium]|nr:hypothetical protein [Bacteroidales bacterium]
MKKLIFTLLLSTLFLSVTAQDNFKKGYIILLSGKQIDGSINYKGDIQSSNICVFKNNDGKIIRYKPGEIKAYRYQSEGYYVSKFVKENNEIKQLFVRYLVKGEKSAYFLRNNSGYHFLLEFSKDTVTVIPYEVNTIWKNGNPYAQEPTAYKGYLRYYFKDQPSLQKQINKNGKPNFNYIIKLTKKYNQLTCGNSCYTVYYKQPSIKFSIEPRVEVVFGRLFDPDVVTEIGGSLYLRLPRAGERWAIRTGLLNLSVINKNSFYFSEIFKIPLRIQYTFTNNKLIQPRLDLGFDLYTYKFAPAVIYFTGSAGFLIELTNKLYLNLGAETIIHSATLEGDFFIGYSIVSGVYIKL